MYNIAIIEDEEVYRNKLVEFICRFENEEKVPCDVACFKNGMEFLGAFKCNFDVIFMDIEMPLMSGLEIAKYLRKIDAEVPLIFVTKMAQFAINGYEVDALDFIVKPVSYFNFSVKLKKAMAIKDKKAEHLIVLKSGDTINKLNISDIFYLEVRSHQLVYHTAVGEFNAVGSLNEREKTLAPYNFVRCNHSYLINLKRASLIKNGVVIMENGDEVPISRSKHKQFIDAFTDYIGAVR